MSHVKGGQSQSEMFAKMHSSHQHSFIQSLEPEAVEVSAHNDFLENGKSGLCTHEHHQQF